MNVFIERGVAAGFWFNFRRVLGCLSATVCLASSVSAANAASLVWSPAGGGNWDTSAMNWNSGTEVYSDPNEDHVTFNNAGGTILIQVGGVTPLSTTVSASSGTYTFTGGNILGGGGLNKSGGGTLVMQNGQAAYSGMTNITGGILEYRFPSNVNPTAFSGGITIDGGTLRYQETGGNGGATISDNITIGSNGGLIDFRAQVSGGGQFSPIFSGNISLGGNLTFESGGNTHTGNNGITLQNLSLTADSSILNNAVSQNAPNGMQTHVPATINAPAHTLTLGGSVGLFRISNATSSSLNLANLNVAAGGNLVVSTTSATDPFDQIQTNGGTVNMASGASLNFIGFGTGSGSQVIDPTAFVWQGNNTMTLQRVTSGNQDTSWTLASDLTVSSASGLTRLNYGPYRSGNLNATGANNLVIGDGGLLNVTIARSDNAEIANLNMRWLNGAVIAGTNNTGLEGGLIRGSGAAGGTLTLGDGTGTLTNPSVITVRGNHGAVTDTFNIGYAANTVENGAVRLKYANTSSAPAMTDFFNVGWSNGGATAATLQTLKETSGGTEFAPLAGTGGVAIVGPTTGDIATFANDVTINTTGTVGFYNRGTNNIRGALGSVVLQDDLSGIGRLAASTVTFDGGSISPGLNGAGTLTIDGNLVLGSTTELNFDLSFPGIAGDGVNDLIAVAGSLTLDGTVNLSDIPRNGTYTLFTYSGTLTGDSLVLPEYATLDLSTPGVVALTYITPIPEPGSCLLLAGLSTIVLGRRKRNKA